MWLPLLLLAGCGHRTESSETERKSGRAVQTMIVEERDVAGDMILSGDIVADERCVSRVVTPVSGKVQSMSVETGDDVCRGQRLCSVLAVEAADHHRELLVAESEFRLAQRELAVKESLLTDGMVSERDVAEAKERYNVAAVSLRQKNATVPLLGKGAGGETALTASIAGTVLSRSVTAGQFVSAGEETFVIADLNRVWVVADVYEADISRIHEGAAVWVETMAWPGKTFMGRIDKIYGALDAESKTMKVRINLQNPDRHLRPGMFATVHVILQGREMKSLPCVSSQAVVFENGHHYVILAEGTDYRRQEVKIAVETDTLIYISEGLHRGQSVVSRQTLLLFNELNQ